MAFLTPPAKPTASEPFAPREVRNMFRATAWFAINVGTTVGAACLLGAALPSMSPTAALVAMMAAVACEIGALRAASPGAQMVASASFSALMGAAMVPMLQAVGVAVAGTAAAYTGALAGALVGCSLCCERGSLQQARGVLNAALVGLLACSVTTALLPASWGITSTLSGLELVGGLALFSALTAADASAIAADADSPHFNPVHRGMQIYLDVFNLFVRIAVLLAEQGARNDDGAARRPA